MRAALPLLLAALALPAAAADLRILGVIVRHQNATQPYTPTMLNSVIFGSSAAPNSIAAFYREVSYGAQTISGNVHPRVVVLPWDTDGCSWKPTETAAALKADGIDLTKYDRVALISTKAPIVCGGGFAGSMTDPNGRRVPTSVTWTISQQNIAHEIGHTIGWYESLTIICYDPATNKRLSLGGKCRTQVYGNLYDVMGTSGMQTTTAGNRSFKDWSRRVIWNGGTQTYKLGPASAPGGLPDTLQVALPAGSATVTKERALWIEYRRPLGFDKRMGTIAPLNTLGAFVTATGAWSRTEGATTYRYSCPPNGACLVDLTPETTSFADAALPLGRSWTDPWSGVTITAVDRTDSELTVRVTDDPNAAPPPTPSTPPPTVPPPAPGESPSGTTMPPALQIVDSAGKVWTLTSDGRVFVGAMVVANSTTTLKYSGGAIYAFRTGSWGDKWYKWAGSGWLATTAP